MNRNVGQASRLPPVSTAESGTLLALTRSAGRRDARPTLAAPFSSPAGPVHWPNARFFESRSLPTNLLRRRPNSCQRNDTTGRNSSKFAASQVGSEFSRTQMSSGWTRVSLIRSSATSFSGRGTDASDQISSRESGTASRPHHRGRRGPFAGRVGERFRFEACRPARRGRAPRARSRSR